MHKETDVFKRNIHVKSGHIELTTKFQLYALRCFLTSLYVAPCITYSAVGFLTFANKPPQLWYLYSVNDYTLSLGARKLLESRT